MIDFLLQCFLTASVFVGATILLLAIPATIMRVWGKLIRRHDYAIERTPIARWWLMNVRGYHLFDFGDGPLLKSYRSNAKDFESVYDRWFYPWNFARLMAWRMFHVPRKGWKPAYENDHPNESEP